MIFWLDQNLPPALAPWLAASFGVSCVPIREVRLQDKPDEAVFFAARKAGAVVVTKDQDLVKIQQREGAPPSIVRLACGNISNRALSMYLSHHFADALARLRTGETLVILPPAAD